MTTFEVLTRPFSPLGRWIVGVEHAFERERASDDDGHAVRIRVLVVLGLFSLLFLALGVGATRAALFSRYAKGGDLAQPIPNARGELTDRNGQVLAIDVPRYALYLDPHEMARRDNVRIQLLAALPGIPIAKLDRILTGDRREFVIGQLTAEQRTMIHDLALPGVSFEEESGRAYPLDALGAHLVGFSSKDGLGLAGAERAFDTAIRANGGRNPFALSIDLRVQGALEDELDQASQAMGVAGGVGIVVNVRTGEILAMASFPSFDSNAAGVADPKAMVNHAAATVYEPGSVMKVFTVAMGIDAGVATPDTMFEIATPLVLGDQTIHDYEHGPAQLSLAHVFTHSSNIGAARLGLLAGAPTMSRYFHAFGLYDAAPSELAESARPLTVRQLTPNAVASMSFGHSISVSPLALATGMSAILNGGVYRPLTLRPLAAGARPPPGRRVIKESTSRTMLDLMRENVLKGTGTRANAPGLRVGGKTGTATKLVNGHYVEGHNALNLASFAAIFPTDAAFGADRYLVLIMLDEPKPVAADSGVTSGGFTAAPVASRVINRIAPFVGVRRVITAQDLAPKSAPSNFGANER